MNAEWIITVFVVIDDMMTELDHHTDCRARVSDAEILTIALCAAKYFHNHHERAVLIMHQLHYLSGSISVSRFNRRLHQLADWFELILASLTQLARTGEIFIIDSMPLPVCRRVRARRCRKVRGKAFCGHCAAKKEKFFGWRLHLIVNPDGAIVNFSILPAGLHDLTPIHELTYGLPPDCRVLGDKGYNASDDEATILAECGLRLVPLHKNNMEPNLWLDKEAIRIYRHGIETVNSQLERMGVEHLYARTNPGFEMKVQASLLAVTISNLSQELLFA